MPSEDKYHEENPQTNEWLASDPSLPTFSTPPVSSRDIENARAASRTSQAARVQQLAAKLGLDAEALAKRIPEDTLRRLKYPVVEQEDGEGRSVFKHDRGIVNDVRPLVAVDRAHQAIEKGKNGRGAGTPQPRDHGRFSK